VQKSKLESIGELSAGLAHEINQPLGGISMGLENILINTKDGPIDSEYIKIK
jgi:Signal transduction histidine kinase regulating C4-dicarboxylate transport system